MVTTATNIPRINEKVIHYGIDIIQLTGDLEKGLANWFEKESARHLWSNFKQHFRQCSAQGATDNQRQTNETK